MVCPIPLVNHNEVNNNTFNFCLSAASSSRGITESTSCPSLSARRGGYQDTEITPVTIQNKYLSNNQDQAEIESHATSSQDTVTVLLSASDKLAFQLYILNKRRSCYNTNTLCNNLCHCQHVAAQSHKLVVNLRLNCQTRNREKFYDTVKLVRYLHIPSFEFWGLLYPHPFINQEEI